MTYAFTDDYKTDLHAHITQLFTLAKTLNTTREERLQASEDLIEAYYAHCEQVPDGNALERLATLILRDELTDTDRMKIRNNEAPFHSEDQMRRREDGEISFVWAENAATDGRDYTPQTRDNMRKLR